ncbi:MAG: hypothetical protein E6H09_23480, partial [Bacteroidetes bacterium]
MRPGKMFYWSLFLITGFFTDAQTGTTLTDSIPSGGQWRKYNLYIPTSYNGSKAYPLVLNLHGLTSSGIQQLIYGDFRPIADTANFLVVHPEGTRNGTTQFWNVGLFSTPNDVLFMRDLIDSLSLLYKIDADRVYSCGLSNGGLLSYYMACT